MVSLLNQGAIEGSEYFDMDAQIEDFINLIEEEDELRFCSEKIRKSEFDIYRFSDFYTLWMIFLVAAILSSLVKIFQLVKANIWKIS